MTLASFSPVVALFLIPMLIAPPGWSQTGAPSGASTGHALQLRVIGGDGSSVPAGKQSSEGLSVLVTDETGTNVADAAVALRLPDSGASGLFADGSHSAVVYTDAAGKAHVEAIRWNANAGLATIRITATKGDQHAGILLEKTLVAAAGDSEARTTPPHLQPASSALDEVAVTSPPSTLPVRDSEDAAPLNTLPGLTSAAPVRPALRASVTGSNVAILRSAEPSILISTDGVGPAYHGGFNKKKWIIIGLAIAAGAGAAYAASGLMKSSSTSGGSSSISIGAPTVSVGHP